jgi:hypothetical protein
MPLLVNLYKVGFKVLTAVNMNAVMLWDIVPNHLLVSRSADFLP